MVQFINVALLPTEMKIIVSIMYFSPSSRHLSPVYKSFIYYLCVYFVKHFVTTAVSRQHIIIGTYAYHKLHTSKLLLLHPPIFSCIKYFFFLFAPCTSIHTYCMSPQSLQSIGAALFFFVSFISLIADGPHHYHPACGHKGSFHLSPVHALQFFYRDASSALLQLVNQWLNFTYSRSHAFRYERKNTNPTLVRIELTTSVLNSRLRELRIDYLIEDG